MTVTAGQRRSTPLLVRPHQPPPLPPTRWAGEALRVLSHTSGLLRVLGGPGTGKTTLAADVVAERILRRGVNPEHMLVLTANRPAAIALRAAISRRISG